MAANDLFAIETGLGSGPFTVLSVIRAVLRVGLALAIAPVNDISFAISVESQSVALDFFFLGDAPGTYLVIDPVTGVPILAAINELGLAV